MGNICEVKASAASVEEQNEKAGRTAGIGWPGHCAASPAPAKAIALARCSQVAAVGKRCATPSSVPAHLLQPGKRYSIARPPLLNTKSAPIEHALQCPERNS